MTLPVYVLRPEPGASRTAMAAGKLGLEARVAPLFAVVPVDWRAPDPADYDAVLLTSANAILHGGKELAAFHALPLLAVGDATSAAATSAGFGNVTAGNGSGRALVELAVGKGYRRLLHLCGTDRTDLDHADCQIDAIPVYTALAVDPPIPISGPAILLCHSPRAAEHVTGLVADRSQIHIVAISPAALHAAGTGWASGEAAIQPRDADMLAIAAKVCDQCSGMKE